jgi:hypothetical protein
MLYTQCTEQKKKRKERWLSLARGLEIAILIEMDKRHGRREDADILIHTGMLCAGCKFYPEGFHDRTEQCIVLVDTSS